MNIKQIIVLIVIIAVLAGAGVFGYKFLMSSVPNKNAAVTTKSEILPHGTNLDFSKVKKFNPNARLNTYPIVSPTETGLQLNDMISQQQ
jgi:flagellar basal body-associated protein FliL